MGLSSDTKKKLHEISRIFFEIMESFSYASQIVA